MARTRTLEDELSRDDTLAGLAAHADWLEDSGAHPSDTLEARATVGLARLLVQRWRHRVNAYWRCAPWAVASAEKPLVERVHAEWGRWESTTMSLVVPHPDRPHGVAVIGVDYPDASRRQYRERASVRAARRYISDTRHAPGVLDWLAAVPAVLTGWEVGWQKWASRIPVESPQWRAE